MHTGNSISTIIEYKKRSSIIGVNELINISNCQQSSRQYGIDENRILVVGASAGGHLCASTAMLHEELKTEIFCVHPELDVYKRQPDGWSHRYPARF